MNLKTTTYALAVGLLSMMAGCFEAPNFPDTPKITFERVEFAQAPLSSTNAQDTLLITVGYEDGDGDLGLDKSSLDEITYAPILYFRKKNGESVTISDEGLLIDIDGFDGDAIPGYVDPYICENWEIIPGDEPTDPNKDTVFFINNRNSNNFFVTLFKKEGSDFVEIDWTSDPFSNCLPPTNGRFEPLKDDPSESDSPIEGFLTFSFEQLALSDAFEDDLLKVEVSIQDRALNESNVVVSEEFTLAGVQKN